VWLSQFAATGEAVWVGGFNTDSKADVITLSQLRFFERGTGSLWLAGEDPAEAIARLSEHGRAAKAAIERDGASFTTELEMATGLSTLAVKEALRELTAAGLITNDTVDALRQIIRWRPIGAGNAADMTRWLPADYAPSSGRRLVQRRPNVRSIPKWTRPDSPGRVGTPSRGWTGRWSLVRRSGNLGPVLEEQARSALISRQWLDRYAIVSRECWKRERPPISWRENYQELKRLEFRGEARRGYFVKGLGGAQFATPQAVELLRAIAAEDPAGKPFVVIAASDPANAFDYPLAAEDRDPLSRPRGRGALLVTQAGRVALSVEGRGKRVVIADWVSRDDAERAKLILAEHLRGERGARYLMLPDIRPT